ncbi:DUF2812 domain-containing protein [Exiguobacterium sp. SH0S7]|uniref:DUF2812 domain-containing protein n=1 Tax=Exiguobacterium sp. SH0S7 TaxID=2510951 RepID=UPI00103D1E16|nr:DUF2812 domain-containing protein [Exiguobacterium sp. SH0S7]TCI67853.1 DUF2812 domain-containing protein [Exiguobacterium sp. SH0S7]
MKRKYIASWGLALAEDKEMDKLSRMAAKGWHLEKFDTLGYTLFKGEPKEVKYSLDYRKQPDEDYFELFSASGWEHVASNGGEIHIFKGDLKARPIYSDIETSYEKYSFKENEMKRVVQPTFVIWLGVTILLFLSWSNTITDLISVLQFIVAICLISTGLPYLGFLFKRKQFERKL